MKQLLIAVFIMLAYVGISQSEYNHYRYYNYYWQNGITKKAIKDNGVSKTILVNKRGDKVRYQTITNYDKNGNITELIGKNKKGIIKWRTKYTYNDKNKALTIHNYKKGKLKNVHYFEYNEKGNITAEYLQKGSNEKRLTNDWKYNDEKCLTKSNHYRKNGKIKNIWKYEYHSKCKKSKSVLYNSKNKVVQTWTYECKDEGEILKKKKNETQICNWDTIATDYLVKVAQFFNEKGEITKSVSKYTLDTLILERTYYNKNDILTYKATYDKSYNKPLKRISYRKGVAKYVWENKYENNNAIYTKYTRKNKMIYESQKKYKGDILIESKMYNSKGKLYNSSTIDFETKFL